MNKDQLMEEMAQAIEELLYRHTWDRDYAGLRGTTRAAELGNQALRNYERYKRGTGVD